MKKTIAVDFDGVIGAYDGWKGEDVLGEPLPGAIEWIKELVEHDFNVVVHSTRRTALLVNWFDTYAPELLNGTELSISQKKPPAWVTIDDRCICFKGAYPTVNQLEDFAPWWKEAR